MGVEAVADGGVGVISGRMVYSQACCQPQKPKALNVGQR